MDDFTTSEDNDIRATTTSRIEARLRADIAAEVYANGERLKIADLASRFSISHLPVREALRSLAADGLVDLHSHKGAVVRSVDDKFIKNIYDARGAMETYLVARCCEMASPKDIEKISNLASEFEDQVEKGDTKGMVKANSKFHSEINKTANNPIASRMVGQGWELVSAMRVRFGYSKKRLSQIILEHRNLVEALENKNAELARSISSVHCEMAKIDLLKAFNKV